MDIKRPLSNQPLPPHARKVFQGRLFSVYQWEQEMFDGSKEIFEKIARRDTVGVIAITKEKKILVTYQEQPGMKPFIGLPGGIIDEGEDAFTAVQRELLEETGFGSKEWSLWDDVQPTSKIEWAIYTFIAKDCVKVQEPRLDAGEKIEIKGITFDQLVALTADPLFRDKEFALKILRLQAHGKLDKLRESFLS